MSYSEKDISDDKNMNKNMKKYGCSPQETNYSIYK